MNNWVVKSKLHTRAYTHIRGCWEGCKIYFGKVFSNMVKNVTNEIQKTMNVSEYNKNVKNNFNCIVYYMDIELHVLVRMQGIQIVEFDYVLPL